MDARAVEERAQAAHEGGTVCGRGGVARVKPSTHAQVMASVAVQAVMGK